MVIVAIVHYRKCLVMEANKVSYGEGGGGGGGEVDPPN